MSQVLQQNFSIKSIFEILTSLELIARLTSGSVLLLVSQIFPQKLSFKSLHKSHLQTLAGKKKNPQWNTKSSTIYNYLAVLSILNS